ncbi:MAG: ribose-5-phosphate isomerase RpiA [Thermomicrobiales bacterium]|nr:ribose-5-phosphate isomerase RpiA [Thermomicrobiales bacterium]
MNIDERVLQNTENKQRVAEAAARLVMDGMRVGLGSGSTAELFVRELGLLVEQGLRLHAVATSERTAEAARAVGIILEELEAPLDIAIDGADAVDRHALGAIKGLGGALTREKIVALAAREFVLIVDESKVVDRLADAYVQVPVPVEVLPYGWKLTERRLANLGTPVVRVRGDETFITDNGNMILDLNTPSVDDPQKLAVELGSITGVVEHGLFLNMAQRAIVGSADGVIELQVSKQN